MSNPAESPEIVLERTENQAMERLKKVCLAMGELARLRATDLGITCGVARGDFDGVHFYAKYFDPDSPHSKDFQDHQKDTLIRVRGWDDFKQGYVDAVSKEYLEALEAYDKTPIEQRIGGNKWAEFAMKHGTMRDDGDYGFVLEDIYINSNRLLVPQRVYGAYASTIRINPAEIYIDPGLLSSREQTIETITGVVDVFEKADESEIEVTLPVTIQTPIGKFTQSSQVHTQSSTFQPVS